MGSYEAYLFFGEHPIYPGHPMALACEATLAFPNPEAALAPTEYKWPALLSSDGVSGAGDCCYAAVRVIHMLVQGASLDEAKAWAQSYWDSLARSNGFPEQPERAHEQAERYLAKVDLMAWIAKANG